MEKTVLLIGLGQFGYHMAVKMKELKSQVLGIDIDEERVNNCLPYLTSAKIADSTDEAFLRTLGVRNFDVCVVTIAGDFQASLETTALLRDAGAKLVVARASSEFHAKFLLRNGADEVIYPERDMAIRLGKKLLSGNFLDFIFLDNDIEIQQVPVSGFIEGKTIQEINIRKKYGLNIIAVEHDQNTIIELSPDYKLQSEDIIVVIGKVQNIRKLERALS